MISYLICGISLAAIYGFPYVVGQECSADKIHECLIDFHIYEEQTFPNYGRTEEQLGLICQDIQKTILCPYNFDSCPDVPGCDSKCQNAVKMTNIVKVYSNLPRLFLQLCQGTTSWRTKYLEYADCLYNASALYQECYNTSMASLFHISQNTEPVRAEVKCCLYSWALGCYIGKTSEKCGEEAANFVSDGFKLLKPGLAKCVGHKKCERPPLPGQETENWLGTGTNEIPGQETEYSSSLGTDTNEVPGQETEYSSLLRMVTNEVSLKKKEPSTESSNTSEDGTAGDQDGNGSLNIVSFCHPSLVFMLSFVAVLSLI